MKNRIISILLVFCLLATLCISGCTGRKRGFGGGGGGGATAWNQQPLTPPPGMPADPNQPPATPNDPTQPKPNPDLQNTSGIYDAYSNVLNNTKPLQFDGGPESEYALYDINKDGVEELVIQDIQWKFKVYTYVGNSVALVGELDSKYGLHGYDGNGVYTRNGGTGFIEVYLVNMVGTMFSTNPIVHLRHDIQPGYEQYIIDGREVSEDEYFEYTDSEQTVDIYETMLPISDLSLLDVLK